MANKNIVVLMGGKSSEHDVSLVSAKTVIENIDKDLYNVIMVGITKDGQWKLVDRLDHLEDGSWVIVRRVLISARIQEERNFS